VYQRPISQSVRSFVKLPSWGRPCVPRHLAGSRMPPLVAPLQSDNREVHIYIHLHIHGERMRKWESTWKYSTKGMHIFQVSWVKIRQTQVLRSFESNIRDVLQDWRRERSDAKVANLETQIICGIIWNSKKKCTRTGEYTPIFWWETLTSYFKPQIEHTLHPGVSLTRLLLRLVGNSFEWPMLQRMLQCVAPSERVDAVDPASRFSLYESPTDICLWTFWNVFSCLRSD
jgi:hypothetical protein